MSAEIVSKIIEFNNAGVDAMVLLEPGIAWHFFKGAAELKILSQQNKSMPFQMLAESNSFVSIAESLASQNSQLQTASSPNGCDVLQSHTSSGGGALTPYTHQRNITSGRSLDQFSLVEPMDQDGTIDIPTARNADAPKSSELNLMHYRAGIIRKSVKLVPNFTATIESISGALLVYNLAVVEHAFNALNGQPVLLYHLAASMLDADSVEDQKIFRVILNNTGAFYWENNLIDEAQSTMRQLQKQMEQCSSISDDAISTLIMHRNIQNILSPPRPMISPAA